MALFTINRYTGDEKEENNLKRSASDLLKELQNKAKKKRELKIVSGVDDDEENEFQTEKISRIEKKKKNKRKKKLETLNQTNIEKPSTEQSNDHQSSSQNTNNGLVDHETMVKMKVSLDDEEDESDISMPSDDEVPHSVLVDDRYDPIEHFKAAKAGGFTIIGSDENVAFNKVKRKLPDWLIHPHVIEDVSCDINDQSDLTKEIDPVLIDNLHNIGITSFFPVQLHLIPAILRDAKCGSGFCIVRPRDLCVSAPTGSGKTIAFVLPIIQVLMHRVEPQTRALIVLPTRELASQIHVICMSLCRHTKLRCVLLTGSKGNMLQERNILLNYGKTGSPSPADIVVATPGRLVDHLNAHPDFMLTHLRFLVIDEADRMMDQIKQDWLGIVETAAFGKRQKPSCMNVRSFEAASIPVQKLLFSATLSADPEKLEKLNLFQPQLYTSLSNPPDAEKNKSLEQAFVGKYTTPVGLKEYMIKCTAGDKPLVLLHIAQGSKRLLCFAGSLETTRRLTLLIQSYAETTGDSENFTCAEFSSQLPALKRAKILKAFKSGKINILVCSDAMARGMDIRGVSHVVLYDAPPLIKTYIHRIGRTARAGEAGIAYTLLRHEEVYHFKKMLEDAGKSIEKFKIQEKKLKKLTPVYEQVLPLVAEKLKAIKR